jgi:glucosylceramidase
MFQRNGYTEIGREASSSDSLGAMSKRNHCCHYFTTALALASIVGLLYAFTYPFIAHREQIIIIQEYPQQQEQQDDPIVPSSAEYRPACQSHSLSKTVSFIQTSMTEPSRQWSPQICVPAKDSKHVELNTAMAPDARIRVNFSDVPFNHTTILGFGGAFTEAAALNFKVLSARAKDAVMELLFGFTGLGYTLGRVHINSCDFSVDSYTFDDTEDDFDLVDFDMQVSHNVQNGMVDMAQRAAGKLKQAWGNDLKLMASPWSPPAWMKAPTREDPKHALHAVKMTNSHEPNCLRDGVGGESKYAAAWALYFSKFLTAYENLGIPFWSVTVQNEPEFAAPWEACAYTAEIERDFVANHLGPQLKLDHPDVKLLVFDHNKDHVNDWVEEIMNASSNAAAYVDGTAYHWYAGGMDRLLDGALGTPNMHRLQEKLRRLGIQEDHIVLGSESCHCPTTSYAGGSVDIAWARAERYAHTILADLAAGSHGMYIVCVL